MRGLVSMRVPRFPLTYIGIIGFLMMTPIQPSFGLMLAIYGFLVSWAYLRFYKPVFPDLDSSQPTSLRGDASETFAFAEFFPAAVKPIIATLSDQLWQLMLATRLCAPRFPQGPSSTHDSHGLLHRGAPGSARAEAERRRALALKALDQRLNAAGSNNAKSNNASTHNAMRTVSQPPLGNQQPGQIPALPQSHLGPQTATTSQPGLMLGETSYDPDNDGKGDS